MYKKKGFTLIEVLLVVALMTIIATASFPALGNIYQDTLVEENTILIKQSLQLAREKSLAGINSSNHGVYFQTEGEDKKIIVYEGNDYASRNQAMDRVYDIEGQVKILLNPIENEINFRAGDSLVGNYEVTIDFPSYSSQKILVSDLGIVYE